MTPSPAAHPPARLVLEDGTVFHGLGFGAAINQTDSTKSSTGEVVFNTAMTGYQEALTDPSYAGQILTMTATQIGNYGVNREDVESGKPQVAGFVIRELSRIRSNHRSTADLSDWLAEHGYRYLVVRRGGQRQFVADQAVAIETAAGQTLRLQKQLSADGREVLLNCHSELREAKEAAIVNRFSQGFELGLNKLADGLGKPRGTKLHDKLVERIGKLKAKSRGTSQHYEVTLATAEDGKTVTALTWLKVPVAGTMATHPGVYCLRSNELTWDEEQLWRTYTLLTDLESVFRSLKSELGLRPVFHSKEDRCDGHLFITVLAYQCVQVLRLQLGKAGIHESWSSLRSTLSVQRRVTASMRRKDGRTVHVRKSTVAEPALASIYKALGISAAAGGTKKLVS